MFDNIKRFFQIRKLRKYASDLPTGLLPMSQIRIDMVYFKALVMPLSYVISLLMTIFAACVVCFIFYFKLEKINMAEALKSVE